MVFWGVCCLFVGIYKGVPGSSVSSRGTQEERLGQVRVRPRKDTARVARESPFSPCRLQLSSTEHDVLDDNTHETGFNGDDGSYVILTWVGDGTGVILVLSTINAATESFAGGGSSRLYRSTDYGKSFHDISHQINHTFIREEFGVSVGPGSSVILTADIPVVDHAGGIIFTSTDAGATFTFIQLPFHLVQPITYHFLNHDYLVALSLDDTPHRKVNTHLFLHNPRVDYGFHWTLEPSGQKCMMECILSPGVLELTCSSAAVKWMLWMLKRGGI